MQRWGWGGARNEEEEKDDTYKGESHAQGGRQHRNVTGPDQSLCRLFILVDLIPRMSLKLQTLNASRE